MSKRLAGAPGVETASLAIQSDLSRLTGATIYSQALLFDPGGPQGCSFSAAAALIIQ